MNSQSIKLQRLLTTPLSLFLLLILVAAFFVARPSNAQLLAGFPDSFRPGEIIVGLVPGTDIIAFNARYGTTIKDHIADTDQFLLSLPVGVRVEDKLAEIAGATDLLFSGPNFNFLHAEVRQRSQAFIDQRSQAFIDGNSPVNFYGQPSMNRLHLTEAQQYSRGSGVRVAVIDTGIDFNHPLLAGRIAYPNFDFVDNDYTPQEVTGGVGYGHGTFVSGLIALTAPDATIMPLRAFDQNGIGASFNLAKAIRFAADNGAQVTNMSFGLLDRDKLIDDAITYAHNATFQVAAAGNDNQKNLHFPAIRKTKTFGVTSTDANDIKAVFANYHRDTQASAPGVNLYSAYPGRRWAWWSGTSFSTALVSGQAALILQLNPGLKRSAIGSVINSSGVSIDVLNPVYASMLGRRIDFLTAVVTTLSSKR